MQPCHTHPLIGLTTTRNLNQFGFDQFSIAEAYCNALVQAGAIPVLISLGLPEAMIDDLTDRLDGIVFTGGGDIHPQTYDSSSHPLLTGIDTDRDRVELRLLQMTLQKRLPFLGICRGFQVINVGMGGSLYEDILDQRPETLKHQYFPDWPRNYLAHTVSIEEQSHLASIIGGSTHQVNSLHHQGVKALAAGLRSTACAPDGLIEAFELESYPFGIGVQWHPEWLQEHPPMQALFRVFVQAARDHPNKP